MNLYRVNSSLEVPLKKVMGRSIDVTEIGRKICALYSIKKSAQNFGFIQVYKVCPQKERSIFLMPISGS
jgi:hypothetical protein